MIDSAFETLVMQMHKLYKIPVMLLNYSLKVTENR